jgi:hypothetical protein
MSGIDLSLSRALRWRWCCPAPEPVDGLKEDKHMENPFSDFQIGNFLIIDLIAAGTNALNGALLARNPSHYRGNRRHCWNDDGIQPRAAVS